MSESSTGATVGKARWQRVVVPLIFYGLLLVFIATAILTIDWSELEGLEISWTPLILATVMSVLYRYLGVFIWLRLLRRLGGTGLRGHYAELTYIYAKSWLGRYIPGTATWILGKIYFAGRHGVPRSKLAVSGLLEGALQIVATLIVGTTLVLLDSRADAIAPWLRWTMVAALVGSVAVLIPPVFHRLLALAFRVLRRSAPDPSIFPTWSTVLEATGLYVLGALLAGTSYYFVAVSVYPDLPPTDALYVIGAVSVAAAISLLAFFAPGGLGVRELTLGLLLAPLMPSAVVVVLVVLLRVWSIAVDILFFAISRLATRPRRPGAIAADAT
jgi:uncharacterized membrane protein YbhN (UPF0104 family)